MGLLLPLSLMFRLATIMFPLLMARVVWAPLILLFLRSSLLLSLSVWLLLIRLPVNTTTLSGIRVWLKKYLTLISIKKVLRQAFTLKLILSLLTVQVFMLTYYPMLPCVAGDTRYPRSILVVMSRLSALLTRPCTLPLTRVWVTTS